MRPESPVTSRRRAATPRLGLDLAVEPEVVGHRRPPAVEGVALRKIARLPGAPAFGDVVEVVEVLGERPPRVADVIEEVRADDVTAEAPAGLPAGLLHPHRAHRDLVHA